ncbi:MAG: hypothetical protein BGP12_04865 [Rhodospirillales bacterium 70-18]|nr:MAG: hypothetical protein BGP12_04865 [Rhodospirillales bacterium 70-18]
MTCPRTAGRTMVLMLALLLAWPAWAQAPRHDDAAPSPAAATAPPAPLPADVTTQHTLSLPIPGGGTRTLRFAATAGSLRLSDPHGAPQADIGYVAYTLAGEPGQPPPAGRPVTFVFNGGPGSASAWLHLGALGPWRLPLDGAGPSTPPLVVPNGDTWLDFTDLVFLDPAGTGYGRVLASGEAGRQLWSVEGDIDSLGAAIRRWLLRNDRMAAPKFIVGESYGGFRGPRLVRELARSQGIGVAGLVLISPVLDFGGRSQAFDPLAAATLLPTLAAVARAAHGPVAPADLAEAETYAAGDYLRDLLRGDGDAEAVTRRSAAVAALAGLDPALVRRHFGRISMDTFLHATDPTGTRVGSPYDGTLTLANPDPSDPQGDTPDPVTGGLAAPLTSAMLELYHRLGWQPDARYMLANEAAFRQWNWGRQRSAPESLDALRTALALDPRLHVLVVHGLFDLVTPYFRTKLELAQIPPSVTGPAGTGRLRLLLLPGGHMVYLHDAARAALRTAAMALYPPTP